MLSHLKNSKESQKYFIILAGVLTIVRIFLAVKTPLYGLGAAMHDDFLLVRYADSLQDLRWLGEYNNLTLAKGISFPIFLWVCHLFYIPYPLGLILLWIGALLVFGIAVKDVIKNKVVLMFAYMFLLYSPATFADAYSQRIYRMSVVPGAVLLVVACLVGMFFRRDKSVKKQMPWALGAGVSLSFFWYIREDSIWMLPFVLGALVCSAIGGTIIWRERGISAMKRVAVCLLPILLLVLSNNMISCINYKCYGIYTVSDRTGTYFSKVVSNMLKVENEDDIGPEDSVWITRKQIEKMTEVCPSLKSIEPQIEQIYESGWCTEGEIKGDIIFWALRDAVAWSGRYISAKDTDQFYKNLNEELEKALDKDRLKKRKAFYPSSMGKGMTKEDISFLLKRTIDNIYDIITYEQCMTQAAQGEGTREQLRTMEAVTGAMLIYPDQITYVVSGLIEPEEGTDELKAYIQGEKSLVEVPIGNDFSLELDIEDIGDIETVKLQIFQNGDLKETMKLKTEKGVYCSTKVYGIEQVVVQDPLIEKSRSVVNISNAFIKIYQKTSVILAVFSLLGYLVISIKMIMDIRKRQYECVPIWLIMTGLLGSMIICVAGVSWFTAWLSSYRWYSFFYTSGIIVVVQLFEIFGIYFGLDNILKLDLLKSHKSFMNPS